jgi:hypothetical protein
MGLIRSIHSKGNEKNQTTQKSNLIWSPLTRSQGGERVTLMRPRYAYTPKLLYFIFLFIIDSFRTPSDIIPRFFALFPTSKQRSRHFAPSLRLLRFATTFAYLRASSDFVPVSSEILRLSYFFTALAHHPRSSSRSSHAPPP